MKKSSPPELFSVIEEGHHLIMTDNLGFGVSFGHLTDVLAIESAPGRVSSYKTRCGPFLTFETAREICLSKYNFNLAEAIRIHATRYMVPVSRERTDGVEDELKSLKKKHVRSAKP